jgi:hypothetical protein
VLSDPPGSSVVISHEPRNRPARLMRLTGLGGLRGDTLVAQFLAVHKRLALQL